MMDYEQVTKAAKETADSLFKQFGSESSVIVMIGIPDGDEHSSFRVVARGRCLQVEGLLIRCVKELQDWLWKGKTGTR